MTRSVLISGAGIAGQVLAYWLARQGYAVTVVEQATGIRQTGGHAVDLAGVSVEVVERMGLLPAVEAANVRRDIASFHRAGRQPLQMPRLSSHLADRHIEIQRDDLTTILHEASRAAAEYLFGDTITALTEDDQGVSVTFTHAAARRFDLVVGADGLHSNVRRLVFGPEQQFRHFLGGYLAVFSYPNELRLDRQVLGYFDTDQAVFTYAVGDGAQARALFLFRRADEFGYDHHDTSHQVRLLRETFASPAWELPRLVEHARHAEDFYFDSISQIHMDTWSHGRVTLIGDAGYSPGPAVGGGTALAVLAGHVLAQQLSAADGDHLLGYRNYERVMREPVEQGRKFGPNALRSLVPPNRLAAWSTPRLMRLLTRLPRRVTLALLALEGSDTRTLDDFATPPPGRVS